MTAGIHLLTHIDAKLLNYAFLGMDIPEEVPGVPIRRDVSLALDDLAKRAYRHFVGNPTGWCELEQQRMFIRNLVEATGDQGFLFDMGRYVKNEPEFNLIRGGFKIFLTPYKALKFGMKTAGKKFNRFLKSDVVGGGNNFVDAQITYNNSDEVHPLGDLFTLGVLTAGIEDFYVSLDSLVISPLVSPFSPEREAEKVDLLASRDIVQYLVTNDCVYKPDDGVHVYRLQWKRPNMGWFKERGEPILVFFNGIYESGDKTRKGALQLQQSLAIRHLGDVMDDAEDSRLAEAEARVDAAEERAERIALEAEKKRILAMYDSRNQELLDELQKVALIRQVSHDAKGLIIESTGGLTKIKKSLLEAWNIRYNLGLSIKPRMRARRVDALFDGLDVSSFDGYDVVLYQRISEDLNLVFDQGQSAGSILEDLLNNKDFKPEEFISFSYKNLWDLLSNNFRSLFPRVDYSYDVPDVSIVGREKSLEMAFYNALKNGADAVYGIEGGYVSVNAYVENNHLITLISNPGSVVPSHVLNSLNAGKKVTTGGTGVGTQIIKEVIKIGHGGSIEYRGFPEGGLELKLTLSLER
tara:strand:- start:3992 stop:5731 length:1740 start_codon:yes stop_codon:yes gene_type:complete